ncbi:radical SAM protein with 4Fe4S-binding SPASM domain [Paraburkholderia silvatlantica]|uniref:Radical SAM protein with 4Fe4S-binding SPASM domain n=1 Tax=Paraburkholderia silvatlantica TaxID=321895 RepID=A0A2V4UKR5_9BURK|nr:hypothetical protein [Paraburkholderia silvatlantica]PYE21356.1 radical SAM protein with 4Fe4S-binding SPASM domain [Paraburkholderia silvatlantica]
MHTLTSRIADELDYFEREPDVEPKRRKYRGRCPECFMSMRCAPGCPNEEIEPDDEALQALEH